MLIGSGVDINAACIRLYNSSYTRNTENIGVVDEAYSKNRGGRGGGGIKITRELANWAQERRNTTSIVELKDR